MNAKDWPMKCNNCNILRLEEGAKGAVDNQAIDVESTGDDSDDYISKTGFDYNAPCYPCQNPPVIPESREEIFLMSAMRAAEEEMMQEDDGEEQPKL